VRKRPNSFRRLVFVCAAGVILAGVAIVVSTASNHTARGSAPPRCASGTLGVYAGPGNVDKVRALGTLMQCRPTFAMEFLDGSSWSSIERPGPELASWKDKGYSMIWGIPILPASFSPSSDVSDTGGSAYGLAQGAAGAYDQYFVTLARDFVADGQGSSIIRLGWEFNGGWFPWAAHGSAPQFVTYWRHIVTAMRSVPGQSFTFEWNPTLGDLAVGNLADYYPGDHYVDYVGADVYDQNWEKYPGVSTEFATLESESDGLTWLASFARQHAKPITLPEWGLGSGRGNGGAPITVAGEEVAGGDDPAFIDDMSKWIKVHHVYEDTFFDVGQGAVSPTTNPKSLAALAR
jgi:hypothetical protein